MPYEDEDDIAAFLEGGGRLVAPEDSRVRISGFEDIMQQCWAASAEDRPSMAIVRKQIRGSGFATVETWGSEQLIAWFEMLEVSNEGGLHDYAESMAELVGNLKLMDSSVFDKELIIECCEDDIDIGMRLLRELQAAERMMEWIEQFIYAVAEGNHTEAIAAGIFLLAISGLAVAIRAIVNSTRGAFAAFREFQTVTLELEQLKFKVVLPANSHYEASAVEKGPRLGGGQFGDVFRGILRQTLGSRGNMNNPNAVHVTNTVTVAIKTVRGARVSPEEQRDVVEECSLHMRLIHPSIVRCYGWSIPAPAPTPRKAGGSSRRDGSPEDNDSAHGMDAFWILLEFLDGGSLDEYLVKAAKGLDASIAQVPETWRLLWAIQVGSALAYMHSHGMVHRDVAARNVVLKLDSGSSSGEEQVVPGVPFAKLTDFGLSRAGRNKSSTAARARRGGDASDAPSYYLSFDANGQLRLPIPLCSTAPECLKKSPRQTATKSTTSDQSESKQPAASMGASESKQQTASKATSGSGGSSTGGVVRATAGNDVWAFGVLLWEMQTNGATPFAKITNVVKHVVNGGRLEIPKTTPPTLEAAMKFSWQDVSDRPSMPKMLVDHLLTSQLVSAASWDKAQTSSWLKERGVPAGNALFDDLEDGNDLLTLVDSDGDDELGNGGIRMRDS
eukprot:g5410.t1